MHAKYSHINVSPSVISLLYFLCVEFRKEFFLLRALTIGYLHLLKVLHSTLGVVQHPITNTLGVLIWSMCVSTRKGASIHPFFNSVYLSLHLQYAGLFVEIDLQGRKFSKLQHNDAMITEVISWLK